ncbi:MAG: hypothetical protein ACSHW0_10675 [Thalassotalea sp.]
MKIYVMLLAVCSLLTTSSLLANNQFDKAKDLFIAQFDNLPDSDDMHAQAAVASMLAHADFKGVNYFCVAGAWGAQSVHERYKYNNSNSLFALVFGEEAKKGLGEAQWENARWVDAHARMVSGHKDKIVNPQSPERVEQLDFASDVIAFKAKQALENGGRVFVMEAGQSDITADWIRKLHVMNVPNVKTHVTVVQHSIFNERFTSGHRFIFADDKAKGLNDWEYVTNGKNNQYIKIPDGNSTGKGTPGHGTPDFSLEDTVFQQEVLSDNNPNKHVRKIWLETRRLVDLSPYTNGHIPKGGTDFSDVVEAIWIFDLLEEVQDMRTFWDKYVVNQPTEG